LLSQSFPEATRRTLDPESLNYWVQKAIDLDTKKASYHNNLAGIFQAKGDFVKAVEQYDQSIDLDQNSASVHNDLGNALLAQGKLDEAIDEYHKSMLLEPENAYVHNNLGTALLRKGKRSDAIVECKRETENAPPKPLKRQIVLDWTFDPGTSSPTFGVMFRTPK